jgi:Domain of unknown function (DUF4177)
MRQKLILILVAFLILGATSWAYSQKSNAPRTAWEYMFVEYINGEETPRKLNELGAQGWELVAASDRGFDRGNFTSTQFVLKRAK